MKQKYLPINQENLNEPEYLIKIMSIPIKNRRKAIPMRATEYMCICKCLLVNLYNIPYIKCGEIRLSVTSRFQTCLALNRLNQVKTREILNLKARKKQDSIPNQRSDTNKKDNKQTINLFASFRAARRVLTYICKNVPQAIAAQFSSKVHVNTGKSLRFRARPSAMQPVCIYQGFSVLNRRVYG